MTIVSKEKLLKEIDLAAGVASSKGTIPILSNVLLTVGDGQLNIWSTDLDASLKTRCEAEPASESWSIGVNAKKLREVVNLLPAAEVHLTCADSALRITSGRSKYRLAGVNPKDFPSVPDQPKSSVRLPVDAFRRTAAAVSISISNAESRYVLNGAKLEIAPGWLRMVSTDGHRMMLAESPVEVEAEADMLLTKALLSTFPRIIDEGVEHFDLSWDASIIWLQAGHRTFIARRLSGQFPNYEQVLPDHPNTITVPAGALQAAVRRASLMADSRSLAVKSIVKPTEIQILAQNAETGEAEDIVSATSDGPECEIGLNAKYLLDYCSVFPDGDVSIKYKDGASQVEMRPVKTDGIHVRYVVMPMRF